jgi:hypothetical protein
MEFSMTTKSATMAQPIAMTHMAAALSNVDSDRVAAMKWSMVRKLAIKDKLMTRP